MTSTSPRAPAVRGPVHVVGAGSRLFRALALPIETVAVSGRVDALDRLPAVPAGATVLVFADPPDEHQTRALFLSLLDRLPQGAGVRVIYISTISATFGASAVFPFEGPYARKKRMAEALLRSRDDLDVVIVRVGNVFEHGGWQAIRERCRLALLPAGYGLTAASDAASVRTAVEQALVAPRGHHIVEAWHAVPTAGLLRGVVAVPGLLGLYRAGWARLPIKLAGKLLRPAGVYLPSPDDLNAFLVSAPASISQVVR